MNKNRNADIYFWTGVSGENYKYYIYEIPAYLIKSYCKGNYIFCKKIGNNFEPIWIGEGEIGYVTDLRYNQNAGEIISRNATHVHVHINSNNTLRWRERNDLCKKYNSIEMKLYEN